MRVLFQTIHGSHLYGLARANSDIDIYTVIADNPTVRTAYCRQSILDGVDTTIIDLTTWLDQCQSGVPQACEAMFSRMANIDDLTSMRASFRLTQTCWGKYLRTIKAFSFEERGGSEYMLKRRRHALRLAVNLGEIVSKGWFNPTLRPDDAAMITRRAYDTPENVYEMARYIAGF